MLVKGSYIEENEFQDDAMVYDLIAKKDTTDAEGTRSVSNGSSSEETQLGSADVPLRNGLSLTLPPPSGKNSLETKAKGPTDCNSNTAVESGDDLLTQYEELLRSLDTEAGGKQVRTDRELNKPTATLEEREDEEELDFTSFSAETPDHEKLQSPFGTISRFRSGSMKGSHSVPFTGESREIKTSKSNT